MKQCPVCGTTYTDASLRFCLADGAALTEAGQEQPTVPSLGRERVRVDVPDERTPAVSRVPEPQRQGSPWLKVALAVVIVGLLLIATTGIAIAILYYNTGGRGTGQNVKSVTPTPTASPTPDREKERLQEELANIQKKLDEQKNAGRQPANTNPVPSNSSPGTVTARVNSPGDGFLALRNEPDPEYGDRIAKIPHGSTVVINNCERATVTIGGRKGRWCQVEFNGQTGYVFDAWLVY
jgi:hypothetical protein